MNVKRLRDTDKSDARCRSYAFRITVGSLTEKKRGRGEGWTKDGQRTLKQ
jgi:hypothetical protein